MKRRFIAAALCLCLALLLHLSACSGVSSTSSLPRPAPDEFPAGSRETGTVPTVTEAPPAAPTVEETASAWTEAETDAASEPALAERLHLYLEGSGELEEGKINIVFCPDSRGADGSPDPTVRVWDSWRITRKEEIREICRAILDSELYDSALYGRTLDSMVTEWVAHNDINRVYDNERTRHVDLNRADEGVSYAGFWRRAALAFTRRGS